MTTISTLPNWIETTQQRAGVLISIISGNCRQLSRTLCNSIYAFIPWRHWVWNRLQGKVSQGRRKKCDSGLERCANRVWRKRRSVCARFLCVCVQYKCPSGLHLCQLSLSESTACVPIFLTLPAFFFFFFSQITLFMHVSFSPRCLHAPPYVSYSLSITFSGSPGQAVKCCNLSLSPGLYPRLPSLLRCSWITALTAAPEGGEPPDKKKKSESGGGQ